MSLHRSDFVEQLKWVKRRKYCAQPVFLVFIDALTGKQSGARRCGRFVLLADTRSNSFFRNELERWLEGIHKEP
ncbi:MAG: hypothetical protein GY930_12515 [bacterium]|nr:hypothetical protein [bacterium]